MKPDKRSLRQTKIPRDDVDHLSSQLAAAIWNRMIDHPSFEGLSYLDYADLYEIVRNELVPYHAGPP